MRWHRVRLQLVCAGMSCLLIVAAFSTLLTNEGKEIFGRQYAASSQLVSLHRQGDQKRLQRTKVLGAAIALPITPDCTKVSCISLTFDDGPNPITTPQVVSILETEHVTATFFMVGSRISGNEALLQRMHTDGDEIGNHSWNHPDLTKLTPDQAKQQVDLTQQAVMLTGVPVPTLFRPPYGAINQTVIDAAKPLTIAFWNEDPKDWAAQTAQQVLAASEAAAKPGGVIDMHDIYHVTADSLQPLIDNLKSRGFQFVTMSQLMTSYPSASEFYGGYKP